MIRPRWLVCVALSACAGWWLTGHYGVSDSDPLLWVIKARTPYAWDAMFWVWSVLMYTTPCLLLSMVMSAGSTLRLRMPRLVTRAGKLPPVVPVEKRKELMVVLGEVHHQQRAGPSEHPAWLTIPERGLHTGIAAFGATGSGKTTSVLYPVARQVLAWSAGDERRKTAALVLEVKGDFCHHVREMLEQCGRGADYLPLSIGGEWRYNPLHNDRPAHEAAFAIAMLVNQLYGKGKEPFWQQAYTHLLTNLILLYRTVDEYVTLLDLYRACSDERLLEQKIEEVRRMFGRETILLDMKEYLKIPAGMIDHLPWDQDPAYPGMLKLTFSDAAAAYLDDNEIPYHLEDAPSALVADHRRRAQFQAASDWYDGQWTRMDSKLRSSIVAGIAPLLAVFDSDQRAKHTFCPPKAAYDVKSDVRYGNVLPPLRELIETGKVLALDFPLASEPGLARLIGILLKQDYQRALLMRTADMAKAPHRSWRSAMFLCDEYHEFATCGGSDPCGDDKFFALSRSAKCIPVVATQSLASIKSALPDESDWPTLVQQFRTTVILTTKDEATAEWASKMCGREERTRETYSLSESGADAQVNWLSGRAASGKSSLSASKSYNVQKDVKFEPVVFTELKNSQAVVLAFDGTSPVPATFCWLRPYWWHDSDSYFEHVRKGDL